MSVCLLRHSHIHFVPVCILSHFYRLPSVFTPLTRNFVCVCLFSLSLSLTVIHWHLWIYIYLFPPTILFMLCVFLDIYFLYLFSQSLFLFSLFSPRYIVLKSVLILWPVNLMQTVTWHSPSPPPHLPPSQPSDTRQQWTTVTMSRWMHHRYYILPFKKLMESLLVSI